MLSLLTLSAHLIFLGFIPSPRRGRLEPALEWFSRGVGVKAWQIAIAAYHNSYRHRGIATIKPHRGISSCAPPSQPSPFQGEGVRFARLSNFIRPPYIFGFIPSPRRGRARVGVKAWQTAIAAYQAVHPHLNLPPTRGKESDLLGFLTLSAHLIFLGFIPSPRRGRELFSRQ